MFILIIKKVNRTLWQIVTGRTLNWIPLSDTPIKVEDSGVTSSGDWWYAFKTRAAATKGKQAFERLNAKESSTFTMTVRQRKTLAGLG